LTGWYALQTRSCCEQRVAGSFTALEAFYPYSESLGYRGAVVRRPYFPGYVFCRADVGDLAQRHSLIASPWVTRLVGHGTDPEPIPESQIHSVQMVAAWASELARKVEVIPTAAFKPGELILINHGPLRGVQGYAVCAKDKLRLIVQIQMLGQAVSAEVDATWLQHCSKILTCPANPGRRPTT